MIGAVEIATFALCEILGAEFCSDPRLLTAVPLLITGGIHMDGYLDVTDARHSYGEREKAGDFKRSPIQGVCDHRSGAVPALYAGQFLSLWEQMWLLPGALMLKTCLQRLFGGGISKGEKGRACR